MLHSLEISLLQYPFFVIPAIDYIELIIGRVQVFLFPGILTHRNRFIPTWQRITRVIVDDIVVNRVFVVIFLKSKHAYHEFDVLVHLRYLLMLQSLRKLALISEILEHWVETQLFILDLVFEIRLHWRLYLSKRTLGAFSFFVGMHGSLPLVEFFLFESEEHDK